MILFIKASKIFVKKHGKKKPSYWKNYRQKNLQQTERNKILQLIRNKKRGRQDSEADNSSDISAKMDSLNPEQIELFITFSKTDDCKDGFVNILNLKIDNQYLLIPKIAKMDSSKIIVHIISIP